MASLNSRIDGALADAVGSLTLAELMGDEAESTTTTTVRFGDVPAPSVDGEATGDGVAPSIVSAPVGGGVAANR